MSSLFQNDPGGRRAWTRLERAGMGLVRIVLLFGSAAIALALILTPVLDRKTQDMATHRVGLDPVTTGSVRDGNVFTVRRSILQPNPHASCIVDPHGSRRGAC